MIKIALILLREELRSYLSSKGDTTDVILENIALLETKDANNLDHRIIISLVNIEEESTLKNSNNFSRSPDNKGSYSNTPVFLNLYLLFTANYNGGDSPKNDYLLALSNLSYVISFFQSKSSFTIGNSRVPQILNFYDDRDKTNLQDILNMKVTLELYTLTFEQINHLWGSLGGRQVPFAMYKARLVMLRETNILRTAPLIEEVNANLLSVNANM
jgi:hypothetical protein